MALFRRIKPAYGIKSLQKDSNCVNIQDPSAIWGASDHLPRRNLLTYTEDFSNAAWTKTNCTVSGSDIIEDATASAVHRISQASVSVVVGVRYTVTIRAKQGQRPRLQIALGSTQFGAEAYAYFDLAGGSVSATGTAATASILSVGDGYYECLISAICSTSGANTLFLNPATNANNTLFTGVNGQVAISVSRTSYMLASTIDQSYQKITDWTAEQYAHAAARNVPWLRRNRFLNTATLSTQTVTSVTANPLTVSFTGTGTITFSTAYSGSLVGTGESDRVSVTFTPSAGNLVCTVSGSVTLAQCEVGSTATPYQEVGASWAATYTALAQAAGYPISIYSDRAGTVATYGPDDVVGKLLDLSGENNHTTAPSDAARPTLRLDGNGKWYLDRDLTDDNLSITWPTSMTTTGVQYIAAGDYTTKDSGLTLSGSTGYTSPKYDYGRIVLLKESTNDARIIKYLDQKRGRTYGLGADLITNGGFDADTWWTKDTGWSIGSGVGSASSAGTGTRLYKASVLTSGKSYLVTYTITALSGGAMKLYAGGTAGVSRAAIGTYREVILCGSTNQTIGIEAAGTTTGSVDNVSVQEVQI